MTNGSVLAWHGIRLALPAEWSPVKIDGDWDRGSIQIADLRSPRMAIRWHPAKRLVPEPESKSVAVPLDGFAGSRLLSEDARDVWVGHHTASGRTVEIVAANDEGHALQELILPSLRLATREANRFWSVFDLRCAVPPGGWMLRSHRLNAGDLTLSFGHGRQTLIVRQIGPARLALARQSLAKWADSQGRVWRKFYRFVPNDSRSDDVDCSLPEAERMVHELMRSLRRRRRFFYLRHLTPERHVVGRHDQERDRIVLVDAPTATLACETLDNVGRDEP